MAVALVALFIALSAGAAANLPGIGVVNSGDIKNNTIRSKDVRNRTVRGKDVRTGAITSRTVKEGSLLKLDFAPGEIPGQGPQGLPGPPGQNGATNVVVRQGALHSVTANHNVVALASCKRRRASDRRWEFDLRLGEL